MTTTTPETLPGAARTREIVAANVRGAAASRRKTQEDLGAAVGLSQQAIARRLNGHVAFTVDELTTIARYLDVGLGQLLGELLYGETDSSPP